MSIRNESDKCRKYECTGLPDSVKGIERKPEKRILQSQRPHEPISALTASSSNIVTCAAGPVEEELSHAEGKTSPDDERTPWGEESLTPATAVEGGGEEERDERKESPPVGGSLVTLGMGGEEVT